MSWRQNAAKPQGIGGKLFVNKMNSGAHAELSKWGLSFLTLENYSDILEIGCGGGANVAKLLAGCPNGHVTGIDYSDVSIKTSQKVNAEAIKAGRCRIEQENVRDLSFADESFDLATAFETIYFWPEIEDSFAQVARVLKKDGTFFICNETDGEDPEGYQWEKEIEGMKIYKAEEVLDALKQAGFSEISVEREPQSHWICFTAKK